MLPEGELAFAVPADQPASADWWIVFTNMATVLGVQTIVSPLMSPGVVQLVRMRNGQLEVLHTVRGLSELSEHPPKG